MRAGVIENGAPVVSTDAREALVFEHACWSDVAGDVTRLRQDVAAESWEPDAFDASARHFVARRDGILVAAIRANFALDEPLDFEPILGLPIPAACRREIVSSSRFVSAKSEGLALRHIVKVLTREALLYSWERGCRASLGCASERLVPLYRRVNGAHAVTPFRPHPRTGRLVTIMAYVPDPAGSGVIDDVVAQLPGPRISPETAQWCADLARANA